ncbi:MAG: hypothetical protein H0U95_18880 [Bacteroidetes bacterium]|nr:hypothetical protein [Bacteroidota bacterium]
MENVTEIKKLIVAIASQMNYLDKKQLIDAIASGSKLTKADAGRLMQPEETKEISITITNNTADRGSNVFYIVASFIKYSTLRILKFLFRFIKR